jgi:hypothetical protein
MIRTSRWARRAVHKTEKQIICSVVFEKLQYSWTEFGVMGDMVVE